MNTPYSVSWNFTGMAEWHNVKSRILIRVFWNQAFSPSKRTRTSNSTVVCGDEHLRIRQINNSSFAFYKAHIAGKVCVIMPNPDCVRSTCRRYILSSPTEFRWDGRMTRVIFTNTWVSFHRTSIVVCGDERFELASEMVKKIKFVLRLLTYTRKSLDLTQYRLIAWKLFCNEITFCQVRRKFAEIVERTRPRIGFFWNRSFSTLTDKRLPSVEMSELNSVVRRYGQTGFGLLRLLSYTRKKCVIRNGKTSNCLQIPL